MSWNYRVIRFSYGEQPAGLEGLPNEGYEIHEVYYDDQGNPEFYTLLGDSPYGDTFDELVSDLGSMVAALRKPVLDSRIFHRREGDFSLVEKRAAREQTILARLRLLAQHMVSASDTSAQEVEAVIAKAERTIQEILEQRERKGHQS